MRPIIVRLASVRLKTAARAHQLRLLLTVYCCHMMVLCNDLRSTKFHHRITLTSQVLVILMVA